MTTKFQIKSGSGSVLFEYECESLKEAVVEANLRGANLREADLRRAKNIPRTYINQCSRDLLFIFNHLKNELPELRAKVMKENNLT